MFGVLLLPLPPPSFAPSLQEHCSSLFPLVTIATTSNFILEPRALLTDSELETRGPRPPAPTPKASGSARWPAARRKKPRGIDDLQETTLHQLYLELFFGCNVQATRLRFNLAWINCKHIKGWNLQNYSGKKKKVTTISKYRSTTWKWDLKPLKNSLTGFTFYSVFVFFLAVLHLDFLCHEKTKHDIWCRRPVCFK